MSRKAIFGIVIFLILLVFILTVCAAAYIYWLSQEDSSKQEVAAGAHSVWCNNRYLPYLDAKVGVFDRQHLAVAKAGYLYALLGAYVLQKDNREAAQHEFKLPDRIVRNTQLYVSDLRSGFEANTFEIFSASDLMQRDEVVITFTGSNDRADWITNFSTSKEQYIQAADYVKKVARAYPSVTFTATGYSLGGGLAVHVTKNPQTANLIQKTWVFNPSPKTWADSRENPKIWQAATEHDILKIIREPFFRFLPGVTAVGAPERNLAEHFYLIDSNPVFAHYRWALARNILHVADLAFYKETGGAMETSEPLEILRKSRFQACRH